MRAFTAVATLGGVLFLGALTKIVLLDPKEHAETLSRELKTLRGKELSNIREINQIANEYVRLIEKLRSSTTDKDRDEAVKQLEVLENRLSNSRLLVDQKPSDLLQIIAAEREQIQLMSGLHTGLLQTIGSGFILITAFVAIRNLRLAQKNLEVSENKLTSENIGRATDHLGSNEPIVRLGGVNTLIWSIESLVQKREVQTADRIVDTLAGFIVHVSHKDSPSSLTNLPFDLSAAFQFLISFQDMLAGELRPYKMLNYTDFRMRRLCDLRISRISLEDAKLNGAQLKRTSINDCIFNRATISSADLTECKITNSTFTLCVLDDAIISDVTFRNCKFISADFGSSFVLKEVRHLSNVDFSLALMRKAIFDGVTLNRVQFNGTDLTGASFKGCILSEVSFDNAILSSVVFDSVKATDCTFSDADLTDVQLNRAEMDSSRLRSAKNLNEDELEKLGIDTSS